MSRSAVRLGLAAFAAALAFNPSLALAAPAPDIAELQKEMDALRADYEARMSALEARIKAATPDAAPASVAPDAISTLPNYVDATPTPVTTSANASNPGVSVVLNGNYFAARRDPGGARILGFPMADETGLPSRGFSLGESEVTLAANVDPYLTANLTASFGGEGDLSVEEAFIQSTALPGGLTLKAGRFFSGIGFLNERHAHNWSFIDMPLPYRALLGAQYGDDGVQARWLAPTPFFLELGAEAFRGDAFPAGGWDRNRPGTTTAFVHTGADINDEASWAAGLSYLQGRSLARFTEPGDLFDGKTKVGLASAVFKWAPGGNIAKRGLNLSAEYFWTQDKGAFNGVDLDRKSDGWYGQGVFQFTPRWSAGLRYSQVSAGRTDAAFAGTTLDDLGRSPKATSFLLEYDTSEFGRFRAQYTRDQADQRANDELMLQYTVVFGPHAAHRY